MAELMDTTSGVRNTSEDAVEGHDQCLAYQGDYEMCDGDVTGLYNGLPLCSHHLDKASIYNYPRVL